MIAEKRKLTTRSYHSFSVSPQLHVQAAVHICITAYHSMLVIMKVMLHANVADKHNTMHQHSCISTVAFCLPMQASSYDFSTAQTGFTAQP